MYFSLVFCMKSDKRERLNLDIPDMMMTIIILTLKYINHQPINSVDLSIYMVGNFALHAFLSPGDFFTF